MSNSNTTPDNQPNYQKLFGDLDFRGGDDARSVYSPAAYLTDLLQLTDDEINGNTRADDDGVIANRRLDIESIVLNHENTFELLPYLDIVNEQLENSLGGANNAYTTLKSTVFPIDLPFDLDNERTRLYFDYLDLSAVDFHKTLTHSADADEVAKTYLAISDAELSVFDNAAFDAPALAAKITQQVAAANYAKIAIEPLIAALEISYEQLETLIEGNLADVELTRGLQNAFYINNHGAVSDTTKPFVLSEENSSKYLMKAEVGNLNNTVAVSAGGDLNGLYHFIAIAKKTGLSFTELQLVLRHCCDNHLQSSDHSGIEKKTLRILALVKHLKNIYDLTIEEVCALADTINATGFGEHDDEPNDLFNKTFNGPYAGIEKQYLSHSDWGDQNAGAHPTQYYNPAIGNGRKDPSIELRNYDVLTTYSGDILTYSNINNDFRRRLTRTLGLSEKQLTAIVRGYRSRENEKFEDEQDYDQLWILGGGNGEQENLLNTLYRTKKLMSLLGLSHAELFSLLDVIEHDPLIRMAVHKDIFLPLDLGNDFSLKTYNPYDILRGASAQASKPEYRLWLIQVLVAVVNWLNAHELSVAELLLITTGETPRDLLAENGKESDERAEKMVQQTNAEKLTQLNKVYERVQPTLLSPASFANGPFDARFSRVIHHTIIQHQSALVAPAAPELVRYQQEPALVAAKNALRSLGSIHRDDFLGLGIETAIAEKIFHNLILMGYLSADGLLNEYAFPARIEDFTIETDFTPLRARLHDKIVSTHKDYVDAAIYPSDLEFLGLSERETQELYNNLIFNRYLDSDGVLIQPATFADSSHQSLFEVNSRIGTYAATIHSHIVKRLNAFKRHSLTINSDLFSDLALNATEAADLIENLKWNDYLTEQGSVIDKKTILHLTKETFLLSAKFYPHHEAVLERLQQEVSKVYSQYATFDQAVFADVGEQLVADWVYRIIDENFLDNGYLSKTSEDYFLDDNNLGEFDLTWPLTENDNRIVFQALQKIVTTLNRYRFNRTQLIDLNFNDREVRELVELLQRNDYIDQQLALNWDKLNYFLNVENVVLFNLNKFEDYNKDIFFMLHELAKHLDAAQEGIRETLETIDRHQEETLYAALAEIFGVQTQTLASLSNWLFGAPDNGREQWLLPLLSIVDPAAGEGEAALKHLPRDIRFNIGFERVQRFSRLAAKLKLDADEINLVFHDQDLIEKLSEVIELPKEEINGVSTALDQIDALLESQDGYIYIFRSQRQIGETTIPARYWVYDACTGERQETKSNSLISFLSSNQDFDTTLFQNVQAAFVDSIGRDVVIVDNTYYYREPGKSQRRLSHSFHSGERFKEDIYGNDDAALKKARRNEDYGRFHLLPCMNTNPWKVRERRWGRTEDTGKSFYRIDSAFTDTLGNTYLSEGERIARYSDITTATIDNGYPKHYQASELDDAVFQYLPDDFKGHVDAAVTVADNQTYFFKHDECVSSAEPHKRHNILSLWGNYAEEIPLMQSVSAAFSLPGCSYLFDGEYIYGYWDSLENANLKMMVGFPKKIIDFFGEDSGLPAEFYRDIDAALYIGGNLFLFREKQVAAAQLDSENSHRWQFFPSTMDVTFWGQQPNVLSIQGVSAALSGLDGRTYIFAGDQYYRYSGSDYYQADPGYPRSVSEDWDGLDTVEAAFTWDGKTFLFGTIAEEKSYVRYSTNDYREADDNYPKSQQEIDEFLWNLPVAMVNETFNGVDAILNAPDDKTYLFSGSNFVYYDNTQRWWSEPQPIADYWPAINFSTAVAAAFSGKDGKTYIFVEHAESEGRVSREYYRFSGTDYCKADYGYPRPVANYWGNIKNNILDCEKVDAAVALVSRELEKNSEDFFDLKSTNHIYLFSRNQFYRYRADDFTENATAAIEPGYPKPLRHLCAEPRFKALKHHPDFEARIAEGIDAILCDQRNVYLFKDEHCIVLTDTCSEPAYSITDLKSFVVEQGSIYALGGNTGENTGENISWRHVSNLDRNGDTVSVEESEPPIWLQDLSDKAPDFSQTSAILPGVDHNTYLFASGGDFYNKQLDRSYPIAEYWCKTRNAIYDNNHIDAAFTGVDGKLYLFSADQYYIYAWDDSVKEYQLYLEPDSDDIGVHSIAENWGGLRSVQLAYRQGDKTYLCEHADASGNFRYQCYRGGNYQQPEFSTPRLSGPEFWSMPRHLSASGWDQFDTILVENNHLADEQTLLFIKDKFFVQYNIDGAHWFEPKPIDKLWSGLPCHYDLFERLSTAFVDPAQRVHFFGQHCYVSYDITTGTLGEETRINTHWGQLHSKLLAVAKTTLASNNPTDEEVAAAVKIDAAFVNGAGQTYLFFGEYYVRYSNDHYGFIDDGYPKKISNGLRNEPGFSHLPKEFETFFEEKLVGISVNGVVANERNTYLLTTAGYFVSSERPTNQLTVRHLGALDNNLTDFEHIDAALFIEGDSARDHKTFLFSGDQYLRYSGRGCPKIDRGYPKRIRTNLSIDLIIATGNWAISVDDFFNKGIDAAVCDQAGMIYLFREGYYQTLNGNPDDSSLHPIKDRWGVRSNPFLSSGDTSDLTTAFVDGDNSLVVIKGDQLIRYADSEQTFIEPGFPKPLRDVFHQLPSHYQSGVDKAFTYAGHLYLVKEGDAQFNQHSSYVRYPQRTKQDECFGCSYQPGELSPYYPTTFADHWSDTADFRIYDLQRIVRYKHLNETYRGEHSLLEVLRISGGYAKYPYRMLADLFGWQVDDIKWLKRHNKLAPSTTIDERRFKLEEIEALFDILSLRERLDSEINTLFDTWQALYGDTQDIAAGADQLLQWLLSRHAGSEQGEVLENEVHNKINVLKRNALLDYSIDSNAQYADARDVYEELLIDVEMGETAQTSRIKEAIAALQLYWHRYLINLEQDPLQAADPQAQRRQLKERWQWLRNYRVWEANRKVFLYPENYLRPELRDNKTPEFSSLEQNLLQGDLTETQITQAYQHYLDRFQDLSRLTIAGGYVFDDPDTASNSDKKALLIGHTKSEPIQHYYRFATFFSRAVEDGVVSDIDWTPWEEVNIKMGTERVYPVYTLNKTFVFWAKIETRALNLESAKLKIHSDDTTGDVSAESTEVMESVLSIYYSYYNLNGAWVPAQKLNYEITSRDTITSYFLEFSGDESQEDTVDGIKIRCHFNAEKELDPQADADGLVTATELLKLLDDEDTVVYLKSINTAEEYFLQYEQDGSGETTVNANRVIPGDSLSDSAAFRIRKASLSEITTDTFISIESVKEEGKYLTHKDAIVTLSQQNTEEIYKAFSVQTGAIGKGYTFTPVTSDQDNTVLYFGEDKQLQLAPWETLETLSEQRNASFKLIVRRESKQNNFRFYPDTNMVVELKEGAVNVGQSVYQSGFEVFNRLFPNEYTDNVSLPILIGQPNNDTDYPWVGFDYKGGSFICKPAASEYLQIDGTQTIHTDSTISEVNAAFYHNNNTYLFGGNKVERYTNASADTPFPNTPANQTQIESQWWDDGTTATLTTAIDAAFEDDDIIYLTRGNRYAKFDKHSFENSSVQSEHQMGYLTNNTDGLPALWNSIDAAFIWNNHRYFIHGDQFVSSDDLTQSRDLSELFGVAKVSENFLSDNIKNISGVFFHQNEWYLVIGYEKVFVLPESLRTRFKAILDENYADFDNQMSDYVKYNDRALRTFVFEDTLYLYTDAISSEYHKIKLDLVENELDYIKENDLEIVSAYTNLREIEGTYGIIVLICVNSVDNSVHALDQTGPYSSSANKILSNVNGKVYCCLINGFTYFSSPTGIRRSNGITLPQSGTWDWTAWEDAQSEFLQQLIQLLPNATYVTDDRLHILQAGERLTFSVDGNNEFVLDKLVELDASDKEHSADAAFVSGNDIYLFKDADYYKKTSTSTSWGNSVLIEHRWRATQANNNIRDTKTVDAAFVKGAHLYLTSGDQYYKYDLDNTVNGTSSGMPIPTLLGGYPKLIQDNNDNLPATNTNWVAAFTIPATYAQAQGQSLSYYVYAQGAYSKQSGNNLDFGKGDLHKELLLPKDYRDFNAALNIDGKLFLFVGNRFFEYEDAMATLNAYDNTRYDIIRLSSMTSTELNRKLFLEDGIDALMQSNTQAINERPMFVIDTNATGAQTALAIESQDSIQIAANGEAINGAMFPVDSHLEFRGANGQYYWEIFYHAPMLIANTLNTAQKFAAAKRWYEYIFDPTAASDYWNFLPFTTVDIGAMLQELKHFAEQVEADGLVNKQAITDSVAALQTKLEPFRAALLGQASLDTAAMATLNALRTWNAEQGQFDTWVEVKTLQNLLGGITPAQGTALASALERVVELTDIIKRLPLRYQLMVGFQRDQIDAYLDDPFDPHAIADLRRIAYRRNTVMAYIDNLLDWGDGLFRQYTRESINEARMLYVLAYDLLGKKPDYLGDRALSADSPYQAIRSLGAEEDSNHYDFLFDSPNADATEQRSFSHSGIVHESVANPYFYVPENSELLKYWQRIEDRLYKIRHSLNILGVKQALPLFQPPIDPMALVNAKAGGANLSAALASVTAPVPHYRFQFMLNKARELTDKVVQFGSDMLGNIEKQEAESLSQMQNRQEGVMLSLAREIKTAQLNEAQENLKNLEESQRSAEAQKQHYQDLISAGMISEEEQQIDMMTASSYVHISIPALKLTAAIASAAGGDVAIGPPFASNFKTGASFISSLLGYVAESAESVAEMLSLQGELAGIRAQFKRSEEDWQLQLTMADSEIQQLGYQIEGAKWAIRAAEQELASHDKEVAHNESINTFMKNKFSNEQLYQWMTSKLSGLFFQTYQMAYDLAKGAEKAYLFERGLAQGDVNMIGSSYWDSLHKGLLCGESLGHDLDRLEKSYLDTNARGFEIIKTFSLAEIDAIAFLQLKEKKVCEFSLKEEDFDYDFPGHYNRRIKTIAVKIVAGEGNVVNATLTQLSHKTVLKPDIKAVKYLIEPKDSQPLSIRADWRPSQQIAVSQPDPYSENSNGLFELNFSDDRYLPFEGTGAVSRWRLALSGKKGSYALGNISDVQIEVQYMAEQGGDAFADAVKGVLKPYDTAVHIDLATSFPNEFFAWVHGETDTLDLVMTKDRFPNISGSKLTAIYPLFEVENDGQITLVINDDSNLTLRSGKVLLSNALTVSERGEVWRVSAKGDRKALLNVGLVLAYRASVG